MFTTFFIVIFLFFCYNMDTFEGDIMEKYENKEFCKNCGGYCCKKSGCDYWVDDFGDKSYNGLLEILSSGNISIVSFLKFQQLKNGKIVAVPFLGLRARNTNRDIIDLLSIKTTCSMLTDTGCTYSLEDRPSGGVNLIPGKTKLECRPEKDALKEMMKWESYQKPLRKIVKKYTGLSVEDKLREDVENLFLDVLNGELEKATVEEQYDIEGMLTILKKAYPEEYINALISYKDNKKVIRKTKQSL